MKLSKVICGLFLIIGFTAFSTHAKPCECKDIKDLNIEIQRVTLAEAAWMEIFAWARGLRQNVAEPKSNDELNTKFMQLARTPRSEWDRVMSEPIQKIEIPEKAGAMDQNGEPIVNENFKQSHCDDIVEGVLVHERTHREFYLSAGNLIGGSAMTSRLLRSRSESDVLCYRAQKAFLKEKLAKLKCTGELEYKLESTMTLPMLGVLKIISQSRFPFVIDDNKKINGEGTQVTTLDLSGSNCTLSGHNPEYEFVVTGQAEGGFLQFRFSPKNQTIIPRMDMKCDYMGIKGNAFSLPVQRGVGDVRIEKKDGAKQVVNLAGISGGMLTGTGTLTLHLYK